MKRRILIAVCLLAALAAMVIPSSPQGVVIVHHYRAASATLPEFDNPALIVGLNNFNPVGYPDGIGVKYNSDTEALFDSVSPYRLLWASLFDHDPPYLLENLADQNANNNDLTQTGGARPTLDAVNHSIVFDGATPTGLTGVRPTFAGGSGTGTIYIPFKAASLVETSVLFETGSGSAAQGQVSIRLVAGVFTATIYDLSLVALPNTKVKTISDTGWHIATIRFDTSLAAANQVQLLIDNSSSGVSSSAATNLTGIQIGDGVPNVGARNNAASTGFTGSMYDLLCFSTAHDTTLETSWWTYLKYVNGL